jgi:hypothetical protein
VAPNTVASYRAAFVHFVYWFENTGDQPLFAVFIYSHEQPETIDLPDVLPNLPKPSGY